MTVKDFLDKIVDNTVLDCNRNNLLPSPTPELARAWHLWSHSDVRCERTVSFPRMAASPPCVRASIRGAIRPRGIPLRRLACV